MINGKKNIEGFLSDYVSVPYSFGTNSIMAQLNTMYYHVHGEAFLYPSLADSVTLTADGSSWTLGSIVEIIPADTITGSAFDLHFISVTNITSDGEYDIMLYSGAVGEEVMIPGGASVRRTGGAVRNAYVPIMVPQQPSGTRISAAVASSAGGGSLDIKFQGHKYA